MCFQIVYTWCGTYFLNLQILIYSGYVLVTEQCITSYLCAMQKNIDVACFLTVKNFKKIVYY